MTRWNATCSRRVRAALRRRVLVCGLVVIAGCASAPSAERVAAREAEAAVEVADPAATRARAEALWATRDERAAVDEFLGLAPRLRDLAADDAERLELLVRVSRACALAARGHARDGEQRAELAEQGVLYGTWALLLLAPDPPAQAIADGDLLELLPDRGAEAAEPLFWTAVNLATYAKAEGLLTILEHRERFLAFARRAHELDPELHHGGPLRLLAIDLAEAPAIAGGDMDAARALFEQALELRPERFENHVMFAEHWAIPEGQHALARTLLRAVVSGDPTTLPGLEPEQRLEQRRAAALLAKLDADD